MTKSTDIMEIEGGMDPRDADLLTDEEKQELEKESEADNAARIQ